MQPGHLHWKGLDPAGLDRLVVTATPGCEKLADSKTGEEQVVMILEASSVLVASALPLVPYH